MVDEEVHAVIADEHCLFWGWTVSLWGGGLGCSQTADIEIGRQEMLSETRGGKEWISFVHRFERSC